MVAMASEIASCSESTVRALRERSFCFTLLQHCSMGLKSGEYGGKYRSWAPVASMSSRTPGTLCAAQVVHDHDLARLQPGTQHLFQVSQKDISVGGRLHGHGRQQSLCAHRPQQRQRAPVAGRRSFPHPFPARRATVAPGHLRGRAALIHKHPQPGIDRLYLLLPRLAALPVFRRVLLLGAERLFFSGKPIRRSSRHRC